MKETVWLRASRWLLAALFVLAGTLHFTATSTYMQIVPPHFGDPRTIVLVSGFFEILGGIGILVPRIRRWAGIGLVALLVAVFPANLYMGYVKYKQAGWTPDTLGWVFVRPPLQWPLILWALAVSRPAAGAEVTRPALARPTPQ